MNEAPRRVAHFRIEDPLGAGGMGEVFRGWDEQLERPVALKRIRYEAQNSSLRERFLREARLAAGLGQHLSIVQVFQIVSEGDEDWLVMELLEGRTLQQCLVDGLERDDLLRIIRDVADGLAFAHEKGVIHRDIKPSNIMVLAGGKQTSTGSRGKILDFGLARGNRAETLTRTGVVLGTLEYMSPEQASGATVSSPTDVFSLGTVLYRALSQVSPFKGANTGETLGRVIHRQPRPLSEVAPEVPRALSDLVESMHPKDPRQRPTAAEVRDALSHATTLVPGSLPAVDTRLRPTRGERRSKATARETMPQDLKNPRVLAGILALTFLALLVWIVSRPLPGPMAIVPLEQGSAADTRAIAVAEVLTAAFESDGRVPIIRPSEVLAAYPGITRELDEGNLIQARHELGAEDLLQIHCDASTCSARFLETPGGEVTLPYSDLSALVTASLDLVEEVTGKPPQIKPSSLESLIPSLEELEIHAQAVSLRWNFQLNQAHDQLSAYLSSNAGFLLPSLLFANIKKALSCRKPTIVDLAPGIPQRYRIEADLHRNRLEDNWSGVLTNAEELRREYPREPRWILWVLRASWKTKAIRENDRDLIEALRTSSWNSIDSARFDNLLGQLHENQEDALHHHMKAATQAQRAGALSLEANARREMASSLRELNREDEAEEQLYQALRLYDRIGYDQGRLSVYTDLAKIAKKRESSIKQLESFLKEFTDLEQSYNEAAALNLLGEKFSESDPKRALESYEKSASIYGEVGCHRERAIVLSNLGASLQTSGTLEQAHAKYQEALAQAQDLDDTEHFTEHFQATVRTNIGEVYFFQGKINESRSAHLEALDIFVKLRIKPYQIYNEIRLGWVELAAGEFGKANAHFENNRNAAGEALKGIAATHLFLGNYDAARQGAEEAKKAFLEHSGAPPLGARAIQAHAWLLQNANMKKARSALSGFEGDLSRTTNPSTRFYAQTIETLLDALENRDSAVTALETLEEIGRDAAARGYQLAVWETRLAIAHIGAYYRHRAWFDRARLHEMTGDATSAKLYGDRAETLLQARPR